MDLAYPLTETVEIDGKTYKLNLSFDNVLRLIDMLNDKQLDDITQIETGLYMLLGVDIDYPIDKKEEIFYQIFYETIGKEIEENIPVDLEGNPMPQQKEEKIYSIKQDAPYIYASFYQDYGIDLFESQGKLHWEKFKALLAGLRPDTKFKEIVNIRTMELPTGKGTEKQRKQIKELKEYYRLHDEP
ncbi:bacteriophage Gp15 family protein [Caldifermentibacillus hisashii]|uniref:bacteriophage Gp15 family protein n=1 Tax=Caldifermentibacillus hisashii TaxID=996558 RepID=UPI003100F6DD